MEDLTRDEWVQILVYGGFALYLALSIPRLFQGRLLVGIATLVFWIGFLAVTVTGYAYRFELEAVGQRVLAVIIPGTVVETAPREVTVFRRPDGQFTVSGVVGSAKLSFVLDTGASTIVIRAEDAGRVGIPLRKLVYDIPVSTANGHALTAAIELPELRIGGIVERDVEALVARAGALHENLLGMSFLNRLQSFTFSEDRVVMRGR